MFTPNVEKRSVDDVESESEMYPSPAKKRTLLSKHPSLQEGMERALSTKSHALSDLKGSLYV